MIETIGKERGCLTNSIFYKIEDVNCFNLVGEWKTREDLDKHIGSHQFGVLLGSKTLLSKPMEINFYTVSATEGMDAVNSVRIKNKNLRKEMM